MRLRCLIVLLVVLAAVGAFAGKKLLYPEIDTTAATISSTQTQSFLVIMGIGEKVAANWDGSITATGATILSLKGWRFSGADAIIGPASWKLAVREAPVVQGTGPFEENGIIVTTSAATGPVTFDVKTTQGNFSFSSQDVPCGVSKTFLSGRALPAPHTPSPQFTSHPPAHPFPSTPPSPSLT